MSLIQEKKSCAFCGSQKLLIEELCGTTLINCTRCLSVGPVTAGQSQAQAWERWNQRPRAESEKPTEEEDCCCGGCRHLPHGLLDFELEDFV